ncbi:hypothetical protein L7F22_042235 [Adiantum nelumboides]|nr:hypothetical protein [Adiantum nelumboides]
MGIFNKKSGGKIPPVGDEPVQGQSAFHGGMNDPGSRMRSRNGPGQYGQAGYGAPNNGYGQPPAGQQQQPNAYGGGYGGAGYGGGGYGGQDRFANARAPSSNLGSSYDAMVGNGSKNRNLAYNTQNQGGEDDLEAEYGRGLQQQAHSYDAPQHERTAQEEEDDEVEAVKQQMRFTKQESLASTRNALRIARETEETASGTLLKLGEQSDKLANTERHLDMAKAHSSRADDNTSEINRLNRSIFRPNIGFNKKAKRDAEEARILNRHIEEREEREAVREQALQSQNRVDQELSGIGAGRFGSGKFGLDRFGGGSGKKEDPAKAKMQQRSRFQFEATESDDELEDELDNNMDEIGQLSSRLNRLGKAMGTEINEQNQRIQRLGDKSTNLDTRIFAGTQKLERIGKK